MTRARFQILAAALLFSTGGAAIKAIDLTGWQIASFRSGIAALVLLILVPTARRILNLRVIAVGVAYAATLICYVLANRLLDFSGVIPWSETLEEARRLLASALVDMAETNWARCEALPQPDPSSTDFESDLEEPIYLLLQAASQVDLVPQNAVP